MDASFTPSVPPNAHRTEIAICTKKATYNIWVDCKNIELTPSANALFTAAICLAMREHEPLTIHHPISPYLQASWKQLNDIFSTWHDSLHPVSLHVQDGQPAPLCETPVRAACFFTGGVDSCYTLLKHREEIDTLIYVHGFDLARESTQLRETVSRELNQAATQFGKKFLELETNLKEVFEQHIPQGWNAITHGAALATIAHLLHRQFSRIYVPATQHYSELAPLGSHPLLDPLWSSESLRLIHDGGEASRFAKVKHISESVTALQVLRVCWENRAGHYNCGVCEKCIRTMLALEILGKRSACNTFSSKLALHKLSSIRFTQPKHPNYYFQILEELVQTNSRADVQKQLCKLLRPYRYMDAQSKIRILRASRASIWRQRLWNMQNILPFKSNT